MSTVLPHQAVAVSPVPDAVVVKLGDELADMAEEASDRLASAYAGLMALGLVARNGKVIAAARLIGAYLQTLIAGEVGSSDPIETPEIVEKALRPYVLLTDGVIPRHIPPPEIQPGSFAAGFKAGRASLALVEGTRKVRGRPVRGRKQKVQQR